MQFADFSMYVKRGFQPTQRTQRKERNEMTSLLIGQSQPPAVADTREIIEIKFDLHYKLRNK